MAKMMRILDVTNINMTQDEKLDEATHNCNQKTPNKDEELLHVRSRNSSDGAAEIKPLDKHTYQAPHVGHTCHIHHGSLSKLLALPTLQRRIQKRGGRHI